MITGISHLTLIVKDLERATIFFKQIFDAEIVYSSEDKTFSLAKERFLLVGNQWIAIMQGESLPSRSYNHIAFKISDDDFDIYESKILAAGVDTIPSRPRVPGEGLSLYFYDFDNHLFELHTGTLSDRLIRYTDNHDIE
ncbi:MAG: FosX/FosE/FosI family fosfomycin resistance hydrolase [Armatimonadota bacterium]